ncbi:hypothetical protein EWS92_16520 [Vibrio vulnificus]|uniref:hypothetical protein n=1 Tax=Vibrio vulnificus TaxID=672 RepID=UPI00102C1C97|nr:hypothetical protein [Vibrio vulnificus]EGR0790826.1 hypothetical protein [Vibrio vulnificus]EGR0798610.1 hypothetical protein [Vibrio vulnificus]EGR0815329.1 hypothetical protein [Vibrio vulnificus]EGR0828026.1 hypothetical protein [Vibrio vulnificus]EGR0848855.1 hypothetical protein [Vibrio vulnificus]
MKKVSLLAASVAIALTGCGGSDSGSGSNGNVAPGGIIVTGFDGYFNQAVVFLDKDNNGKLDIGSDTIFGLTDKEGRRTIPAGTQGVLALQTLTPGGTVQTALTQYDADTYAGKYTIDMDHPTQAMAHEVVLRTLPGEKVISPLTDLVVVQAGANPTKEKIEEAKTEVNETLGITGNIAFTDVIAAKNHALHKTAQILTESKVNAGVNYTAENALKIAQEANKIVTAPENQDKLDQPNFKPTVEVTPSGDVQVTVNNKLIVNKSVADNIRAQLNTPSTSHSLDLTLDLAVGQDALFSDSDNNNIALDVQVIDPIDNQAVSGLIITANNGGSLTIKGELTPVRQSYILQITGTDIDAEAAVVGKVSTLFTLTVETPNSAPTIVPKIAEDLQAWIGSIELTQGVAVTNEQYRIDNLFADVDGDELIIDASSTIKELELSVIAVGGTKELKIAGTPTNTYPAGETITISAFDGIERTSKSFVLKQVDAKPIASFEVNTNALANLQSEITSQLVDLKVNEPLPSVQISITLDDIFKAVNAHGPVEYFAGMKGENQDHNTSVAGIKVAVDNMGVLTISGTPLEASTNGEFYIAAGIYPDAEDGVISEMKRIALPEVKAVVTPPSETHPLEGKTWYRLEHGSGTPEEKLPYSRIWCDTLHFENGKVSGNYRTMSNLTQCGELAENSWSNGTYRVEGDQVIAQFGDDPDATLTIRDADDIAPGAKVLFWTSDEGTERYTLFSNKSDAEARIQIRSDDGPEKRFFNMPLPTEVNGVEALGMVSLSLLRNNNPDDTGAMNANLTLEFPDQNFTCENVQEFYENFIITGPGLVTETTDYNTGNVYKTYGVYSGNQWGTSLECHPNDENGVEHATIDFDLPELTTHGLYSFIGKVKSHQGEYIEAIKFNMTWTGTGNNE